MFEANVYSERRKNLKDQVQSGLILIMGNVDCPMNYPANPYHFRQDSNFLYFFGLDLPGLAGLIDVESGEEYIFGNDVDIDDIIWMGPQPAVTDLAASVNVKKTAPLKDLPGFIHNAKKAHRKVHFLPPYRAETKIMLEQLVGIHPNQLKENASVDLIKAVVKLRSIKAPFEIVELEKAAAIGYEMHTTAMKMAQDGMWEQKIAGTMEGIANAHGGMPSFPIILSKRGETLHNHDHSNILKTGDLLLVDAGAETPSHYASDFTRTIPVGGTFTQKQREIYEIVLAANNKATSIIKPGVTYQSIHLEASKVIATGLKDLGLMKGDPAEAVKAGAHAMFFPHGLGHMMGLDVHDMEDLGENYVGYDDATSRIDQFGTAYLRLGRKLEPGFVITNEPGIYFIPALIDQWREDKKFGEFINYDKVEGYKDFGGIRLEDDILVTEEGSKMIGERIPITPEELHKAITE